MLSDTTNYASTKFHDNFKISDSIMAIIIFFNMAAASFSGQVISKDKMFMTQKLYLFSNMAIGSHY